MRVVDLPLFCCPQKPFLFFTSGKFIPGAIGPTWTSSHMGWEAAVGRRRQNAPVSLPLCACIAITPNGTATPGIKFPGVRKDSWGKGNIGTIHDPCICVLLNLTHSLLWLLLSLHCITFHSCIIFSLTKTEGLRRGSIHPIPTMLG